jgi:phosphate starvation-inducible PhoH-like protein
MPRKAAVKSSNRNLSNPKLTMIKPTRVAKPNIYFEPKTENQRLLYKAISDSGIIIASGPAGVGKSWVSIAFALQMLLANKISRIILTRPFVTCGEDYGALPGEIEDKLGPLWQPMKDIFVDFLGKDLLEDMIFTGKIEFAPLGFVRGSTYSDCVIIGDEFQNATFVATKMFLSRIGENAKIILNGDLNQCDINPKASGLLDLVNRIKGEDDFALVEFTSKDCVRSGLARRVIEIYEK